MSGSSGPCSSWPSTGWRGLAAAATLLLVSAVSSFLALNFTGSTPYTSLSGVKREMRLSMPVMAGGLVAGIGLWVARRPALIGRRRR